MSLNTAMFNEATECNDMLMCNERERERGGGGSRLDKMLYFVIVRVRGRLESSQYEMEKAIRGPEPRNNCAFYCRGVTGTSRMPSPESLLYCRACGQSLFCH